VKWQRNYDLNVLISVSDVYLNCLFGQPSADVVIPCFLDCICIHVNGGFMVMSTMLCDGKLKGSNRQATWNRLKLKDLVERAILIRMARCT
jgi:hypothetical protein